MPVFGIFMMVHGTSVLARMQGRRNVELFGTNVHDDDSLHSGIDCIHMFVDGGKIFATNRVQYYIRVFRNDNKRLSVLFLCTMKTSL